MGHRLMEGVMMPLARLRMNTMMGCRKPILPPRSCPFRASDINNENVVFLFLDMGGQIG
jgi:hypothetical protein